MFGLLLLGTVAKNSGVVPLITRPPFCDGQFDGKGRAVLSTRFDFASVSHDAALASARVALHVTVRDIPMHIRHQHADVCTDRFAQRIAKDAFRRGVEGNDASILIGHDDRVYCGIDDRLIPRLLFSNSLQSPPSFQQRTHNDPKKDAECAQGCRYRDPWPCHRGDRPSRHLMHCADMNSGHADIV